MDEDEGFLSSKASADEQEFGQEVEGGAFASNSDRSQSGAPSDTVIPDKVWKRVKDPRGLPEQNVHVSVKSRTTLKDDIIRFKMRLHTFTMRLFDDRMFIVSKEDPGYSGGEAQELNQVIGTNKYNEPITAKIASYGAPGLESLKVVLSLFRAAFNLFTWRDPIMTSIFCTGVVMLLFVLLVFPWRLFFAVVGFGAVGPQVSTSCCLFSSNISNHFHSSLSLWRIVIGRTGLFETTVRKKRNQRNHHPTKRRYPKTK